MRDFGTVVITGANRGIGLQLVKEHLKLGSEKVIAVTRESSDLSALQKLVEKYEKDQLVLTKTTLTEESSVKSWARDLKEKHAVHHIDLLWNNAGIIGDRANTLKVEKSVIMDTFEINCIGPLLVTRALYEEDLLGGETNQSIVANMSSNLGSIESCKSGGTCAYRMSKAALNMLTKCIGAELDNKGVIAVSLHPGWVRTDMGGKSAAVAPEQSAQGMIQILNKDAKELQGRYWAYTGKRLPY